MRTGLAVVAACVLLAVAGCTGDGSPASPASKSTSPTPPAASATPQTWKDATKAPVTRVRLDWRPLPGDPMGWHVVSHGWRVDSPQNKNWHRFIGPGRSFVHRAPAGFYAYEVRMHYPWAVTIDQHKNDRRSDHITVYDLRDGSSQRLRADKNTPRPTRGGWLAVNDRRLVYTSGIPDGKHRFCIADVSLETLSGDDLTCAKHRHGFGKLRLNGSLVGADSFDDHRPVSCRTMIFTDSAGAVRRLKAAARCKGWEVVPFRDGSVFWIQAMIKQETYHGDAYVRTAGGRVVALGKAYTGMSVPCGKHVYFVRDNDSDTVSDDLMRWSPGDGLQKVWTPKVKGHGDVMVPPSCGGTNVTIGAVGGNHGRSKQLVTARID